VSATTRVHRQRCRPSAVLVRALVLVLLVWLLWPAAHGGRLGLVVVSGNSMQPTYAPGEVVLTWRLPVQTGAPVLIRVPEGHPAAGSLVIHRIRDRDPSGWITQGDNSPQPDRWRLVDDEVLGRALFRIRGSGTLLRWAINPLVLGGIAGALTVALMWPVSPPSPPPAPIDRDPADRRRR
jgi:signal peptidase I